MRDRRFKLRLCAVHADYFHGRWFSITIMRQRCTRARTRLSSIRSTRRIRERPRIHEYHRLCVIYFRSSGSSKISAMSLLSLIIIPIGYLLLHYYRAAIDCVTVINYALRDANRFIFILITVDASWLTPDRSLMQISWIPSNILSKCW